jgi:hypothetical protein
MSTSPWASTGDLAARRHSTASVPRVEALFLVRFDKRVGYVGALPFPKTPQLIAIPSYTTAWQRSHSVALDGVEFKSLPSGLHAVESDLVYFTHEGHAGLSAFARGDASAEERGATFVAVGMLVKKEGAGRLGRGWLHAERLAGIARALVRGDEGEEVLEKFWEETKEKTKSDGESDGEADGDAERVHAEQLPKNHPALAIVQYMDTFGPLVFRLQQAALLRKRILFVGSAPVRTACEFGASRHYLVHRLYELTRAVYNLSVLSSISPRDAERLIPSADSILRLPTLFCVGVHDIAHLESVHDGGWAACTTDEILTTKNKLYDIIVELPSESDLTHNTQHRWPRIRTSAGDDVKASQRDVARYKLLHRQLWAYRNTEKYADDTPADDPALSPDSSTAALLPLVSRSEIETQRADDAFAASYDDSVVEPMTWSRLAYLGFMWWASAGERDAYSTAEQDLDRALVSELAEERERESVTGLQTAVVKYFHRQSSMLVQTLAAMMEGEDESPRGPEDNDEADDEADDDEDEGRPLYVDRDDLSRMGLDTWSEADRAFAHEFGMLYFGRGVEVRGNEANCCGLRVPVF